MDSSKGPRVIERLLGFIDSHHPIGERRWNDWCIDRIGGGANNLIYRIQNEDSDYAVKFTIKDERKRARREFVALRSLREAGLIIAPEAFWLDEESYSQPVVVQSWLAGQPVQGIPNNRAEWQHLLAHYASIHSVKKNKANGPIENGVLNFRDGWHGKRFVLENAQKLPAEARRTAANELLIWFESWEPPVLPPASLALCRVDPNWRNFIRQDERYMSVDWENSGWGDPAFEIADIMSHPEYENVPAEDWAFVIQTYADLAHDQDCKIRIETYYLEMLIWWVVRWLRYLFEIPRGLDERLVERPSNWQTEMEKRYAGYVEKAQGYIATL